MFCGKWDRELEYFVSWRSSRIVMLCGIDEFKKWDVLQHRWDELKQLGWFVALMSSRIGMFCSIMSSNIGMLWEMKSLRIRMLCSILWVQLLCIGSYREVVILLQLMMKVFLGSVCRKMKDKSWSSKRQSTK